MFRTIPSTAKVSAGVLRETELTVEGLTKARHKNTFTKKAFVHLPAGTKKKEMGTVWISDCCNHNQTAFAQSNSFHISFAVGLHFLLVRSARIHLQHCHHEYWYAKTFYSFRKHSEDPPFAPQHLRKEEFLHGSMGFWYSLSICVRDTYGMRLFNFHSNSWYLSDLDHFGQIIGDFSIGGLVIHGDTHCWIANN